MKNTFLQSIICNNFDVCLKQPEISNFFIKRTTGPYILDMVLSQIINLTRKKITNLFKCYSKIKQL